jgi:hypothetical protein
MNAGVIMDVAIDAVSPRVAPTVRVKDCLDQGCGIATALKRHDPPVVQKRQPGIIWDVAVGPKSEPMWTNVAECCQCSELIWNADPRGFF